jgi:hypothetical protein
VLQAAIPSVAVISLTVFLMFVHQIDIADPLWQYLGRYETLSSEEVVGSGRADYYRRGEIDIEKLLAPYLLRDPRAYGPDFDRQALVDVNRDLFPKDEFAIDYRGPLR